MLVKIKRLISRLFKAPFNEKELASKIDTALAKLGETSEDVAKTLSSLGIKGVRTNSRKCLIANFINHIDLAIPDYDLVLSPPYLICRIDCYQDGSRIFWVQRPLPGGVRQFIIDFDNGNYPDLIV